MDRCDLRAKGYDLIAFVPANSNQAAAPEDAAESKPTANNNADSQPSRFIYEKIIAQPPTTRKSPEPDSPKQRIPRRSIALKKQNNLPSKHQVLSAAEEDNLEAFRSWDATLLTDTKDDYGWTPLMCAAHAGSASVVNYLLEHITTREHLLETNHTNSTAAALAAAQGYAEIVSSIVHATAGKAPDHAVADHGDRNYCDDITEVVDSDAETVFGDASESESDMDQESAQDCLRPMQRNSRLTTTTQSRTDLRDQATGTRTIVSAAAHTCKETTRYCDVCACDYTQPEDIHLTSIMHQMQSKAGSSPTEAPKRSFGLQPTNRGYQMLLQQGWDEGGLGAQGQGRLFPVKTVLKRDRRGVTEGSAAPTPATNAGSIASTSSQARVTHFNPFDAAAVAGRSDSARALGRRRCSRARDKHETRTNHPQTLAVRDREQAKRLRTMLTADHEYPDDGETV
eukprot:m.183619 g.183619  ORF g.183619 m.183619 type:complete len:454 (-) comp18481_c1_seq1:318-1679(-)